MIVKSDHFVVAARKPFNAKSMKMVNNIPVPYASKTEALAILVETVTQAGQFKRSEGDIILVLEAGLVVPYWFVGGIADVNFVKVLSNIPIAAVTDLQDTLDEIPDAETGSSIKLKLQNLSGTDRLNASAIQGLETEQEINTTYKILTPGTTIDYAHDTEQPYAKVELANEASTINLTNTVHGDSGVLKIVKTTDTQTVTFPGLLHGTLRTTVGKILLTWFNDEGEIEWFIETTNNVAQAPVQLDTPTLVLTALSPTSVKIDWTDVNNESSYKLERTPFGQTTWTQVGGTIAANTVTYTDTTVVAETQYTYRISAIGNGTTYLTSEFDTESITTPAVGNNILATNERELNNTSIWSRTRVPTVDDLGSYVYKIHAGTETETHYIWQNVEQSTPQGTYSFSVNMKAAGYNYGGIFIYNNTGSNEYYWNVIDLTNGTITAENGGGTSTVESLGSGLYKVTLTGTFSSALSVMLGISVYSDATGAHFAGVSPTQGIEASSPVFETTQVANLFRHSEALDNTSFWTRHANIGDVAANVDGTMDKIIPAAMTGGGRYIWQTMTKEAASGKYTFSGDFKAAGYDFTAVEFECGAFSTRTVLRLTDGVWSYSIGTSQQVTIVNKGNGIYRMTIIDTLPADATVIVYLYALEAEVAPFTGDGIKGVLAGKMQLTKSNTEQTYTPTDI